MRKSIVGDLPGNTPVFLCNFRLFGKSIGFFYYIFGKSIRFFFCDLIYKRKDSSRSLFPVLFVLRSAFLFLGTGADNVEVVYKVMCQRLITDL